MITRVNERKLMTRLEKRNITLKNAEKLLEGIISGKINKKKARDMSNNIAEYVNKLNRLELKVPLQESFMGTKADDGVDDEVDDKAQLKAGNNSQKLKNEIRQLLYSLYRSKKLSKTIYNCLLNTI